jgi:hypothetical protein
MLIGSTGCHLDQGTTCRWNACRPTANSSDGHLNYRIAGLARLEQLEEKNESGLCLGFPAWFPNALGSLAWRTAPAPADRVPAYHGLARRRRLLVVLAQPPPQPCQLPSHHHPRRDVISQPTDNLTLAGQNWSSIILSDERCRPSCMHPHCAIYTNQPLQEWLLTQVTEEFKVMVN